MHIFFQPQISEGLIILDQEESRHCVKVLRMRPGQNVMITDGTGHYFPAVLSEANPKACVLQLTGKSFEQIPRPFKLHLVVAPTKNIDRFEWLLEKATECGIDQISPVFCQNSERTTIKSERLNKILVAAMKQSQRAYLPELNNAVSFKEFISRPLSGKKFIAHCAPGEKKRFQDVYKKGQDAIILIGPEGDFSPEEVEQAIDKGFEAISIGEYRLRTETAALTLCIQANLINELL